ncbi:hypothetical protein JCM8547_001493 [Rhodosporidiobolus lusitaniae]
MSARAPEAPFDSLAPPASLPLSPLALLARARQTLRECVSSAQADDVDPNAVRSAKVLKTCAACRALKIRCTGEPGGSCQRCTSKGFECVWVEGRKMGRKVSSRRTKKLHELQDDLGRLETLLQQQTLGSAPSTLLASPHPSPLSIAPTPAIGASEALLALSATDQLETIGREQPAGSVFDHVLDADLELDPINLGLLTEKDFERFLTFYYTSMHRYMMLLDPALHTPLFLRRVSPFLTTIISLITSTYDPQSFHLVPSLEAHAQVLATRIYSSGYKSVEVVLGFCLWAPWTAQLDRPSSDRSWSHVSMAVRIAAEIRLDQPLPSAVVDQYRMLLHPFPVTLELLRSSRKRLEEIVFCVDLAAASQTGRVQTLMSVYSPRGTGGEQSNGDSAEIPLNNPPTIEQHHLANLSLAHYFAKALVLHAGLRSNDLAGSGDLRDAFNQSWKTDLASWDQRWAAAKELPYLSRLNRHIILLSYSLVLNGGPAQPVLEEAYRVALHAANYVCEWLNSNRNVLYASNFVIINIGYSASFLLRFSTRFGAVRIPQDILNLVKQVVAILSAIGSTRLHGRSLATSYADKLNAQLDVLSSTSHPHLDHISHELLNTSSAGPSMFPPPNSTLPLLPVSLHVPSTTTNADSSSRPSTIPFVPNAVDPPPPVQRDNAHVVTQAPQPWAEWTTDMATDPRALDQLFSWFPAGGEDWGMGDQWQLGGLGG